jgi:glycosyltransferase involved in cell wall biosynthesis
VAALERLLGDYELRRSMGEAGREFVEKYFDRRIIWAALENKYRNAINRVSKAS